MSMVPPQNLAAALQQALSLHRAGQFAAAESLYRQLLEQQADHLVVLQMLGVLLFQTGRQDEGVLLLQQVVVASPNDPAAHNNLGNALRELGQHADAAASFEKAITLRPDFVDAWSNWGNALNDLCRFDAAVHAYDQALALQPRHANALNNRASALNSLRRYAEALRDYDQSIALQPQVAETYSYRAAALMGLGRTEEALQSCEMALQRKPDLVQAHWNRVNALQNLKRYPEAVAACDAVLAIDPFFPYAHGAGLGAQLAVCDWRGYGDRVAEVTAHVRAARKAAYPFSFLPISDSPADQYACSRTLQQAFVLDQPGLCATAPYQHQRLRVAYLSADFHEHATAYLMAELFERHDRQRFEVYAYSFGPSSVSPMRGRLMRAFEHFHDVVDWTDEQVAQHMRAQEIDIAVDLKGYTAHSRTAIFALRPAPIQVNYLGYPGTMAADFIDYLVGDAIVTPPEHDVFYTEKVVRLPGSYQVNDRQRVIAPEAPSREACGLPEQGFVFCCFNNNYKINPPVFDIWMRLLQRVPGSVLWLLEDNSYAKANLQREAQARGVDPQRLVFAARAPLPDHLARHRHAGLFLDTLPVNAHTTASDALWAGLPVLTCLGGVFAGRVAASLLHAVGMPDLVAADLQEYESKAYQLATDPNLLNATKARLWAQRDTCALFDSDAFRLHLEAAYQAMHQDHWQLPAVWPARCQPIH